MKSPETLLSTAALRRAMELWTDPHVLASCGDAMAPAASLAVTAVEYYQEENKIFAKDYQVKQFNDEVDQLSIRLEKLKRKMQEIN